MTENKNVETILKNGDKALSGMPYLYRSKGLALDTDLISYIGQFDMPGELVDRSFVWNRFYDQDE